MNVCWIAAHFEDITTLAHINSPQGVVSIAAGEGGWRKSHLTSCPALLCFHSQDRPDPFHNV